MRMDRLLSFPVRSNFSSGKSGVRNLKGTRSRTQSGSRLSIFSTFTRGRTCQPRGRAHVAVHRVAQLQAVLPICCWLT